MTDHMTAEEWPCRRLPRPHNGDGPSTYLMQLDAEQRRREGQAMLWAGDFTAPDTDDSGDTERAAS